MNNPQDHTPSTKHSKNKRKKSALILDEDDLSLKQPEIRLEPDDKERMTLNPGRSLKSSSKDLPKFMKLTFRHSLPAFVMAYFITYLPGKISAAILANLAHRMPVIYHNEIMFRNISGWEKVDALSIFSAPIVTDFLCAVLFGSLFNLFKHASGIWRYLLFWLMVLSYTRFAGCVLPGRVSGQEFGYVAGWLYMGAVGYAVCFVLSLVLMAAGALLLGQWALETAFSRHMILPANRQRYLANLVGYPAIGGSLVIALYHLLDWSYLFKGALVWNDVWSSRQEFTFLVETWLMWFGMAGSLLIFRDRTIINQRDLRVQRFQSFWVILFFVLPLALRIALGYGWSWY